MQFRDYLGDQIRPGYYAGIGSGDIYEVKEVSEGGLDVRSRISPSAPLNIDVPGDFAQGLVRLTAPESDAKFMLRTTKVKR